MKNMLELSKLVLQKVSFDSKLFQKELRKSLNWIKSEDRKQFKTWVNNKFGKSFNKEISKVFNSAN
jgi:hypothetical protein